ncbi:MAG: glutaredoxin domain-containing protein [Gammaproteobacteria bacterium]|nr:glutaredoxin domain-containing protein [Gammaproteobacteria bacterium]
MAAPRITLYSTRNCPHCRRARQYLEQKGLRVVELDIHHSARGRKDFDRLGARGVPLIVIGDICIAGFDRRRIDAALQR